jgi:predicted nucleic acid-binding protein
MEVLYLAEKNRIGLSHAETLEAIEASPGYAVVDLSPEILKAAVKLHYPELHDRLILATAQWLGIGILSSGSGFAEVDEVEIIWD